MYLLGDRFGLFVDLRLAFLFAAFFLGDDKVQDDRNHKHNGNAVFGKDGVNDVGEE